MNFWNELPKPIIVQAPMEDVTDTVFRQMLLLCGRPDVFFTEFTSCDGLLSRGYDVVSQRLKFSQNEHPIVAQIWGNNPKNFAKVSKMLLEMGFDGIDINMGCPDKSVISHGCGGMLIENHSLVSEIVYATQEAVPNLPLSIKTRIGVKTIVTEDWIRFLLTLPLSAIVIHARTVKELSKVPAHWEEIGKAIQLRNKLKSDIYIIGNGDVENLDDAYEKGKTYRVDGVMIGRGMFENPWIFNPKIDPEKISLKEKMKLLHTHLLLFQKTWENKKYFGSLKKLYKMYIADTRGASEIRTELVRLKTIEETIGYVEKLLETDSVIQK